MKRLSTLFILSGALVAQTFAIVLELKPDASVMGSDIKVVDILAAASDVPDDVLEAKLGASPAFGQERVICRAMVENALPGRTLQWSGVAQCKVTRPARLISSEELKAAIEGELKKLTDSVGDVRVYEFADNKPFYVPQGELTVQISLPASVVNSAWSTASVRYMLNGETLLLRSIRFRWCWERGVWIAKNSLNPDDPVRADDFNYVTQDILKFCGQAFTEDLAKIDMTLARSLRAGDVLTRQCLKSRALVRRGNEVIVNYRNHAVSVAMKGTALENGSRGQVVTVKNNTSNKRVLARVIEEGVLDYEN